MDIILSYGESHQNSVAAADLYAQRFPQSYHLRSDAFFRVEKLATWGYVYRLI